VKSLVKILGSIDRGLTVLLKWLTIVLFIVIALIVTANILLRFFPVTSFHWMDEIVEMSFAALVFYGAAAVWMTRGNFSVGDWFGALVKNARARSAYRLLLELVTLAFAVVLFLYSSSLVLRAIEVTAVFQIPKKILYSCMPLAGLIMVAYSLVHVVRAFLCTVKPGLLAGAEGER
jgi:TRAP-type transport system small permease protein